MAETLKFGPQWLHNLLDGNAPPTSPPSTAPSVAFTPGKYKLAEHRYGREEMLALYVPNAKTPDGLRQFSSILRENPLQPMAFIPPSDEEQRLMSQSVNSVAVLRMMGRGAGPSQRGGRGGGDRGRGRGRGRGEGGFSGFLRQTSLEEDGYVRGRQGDPWEEGEKGRFDRGALGFGPRSVGFDEGPTSPRKDFSRSMSSDNWREARAKAAEEEDDGGDWRRAGPRDKWGTRGSWRDHRERDRDRDYDRGRFDDYEGGRYERPYRTKSGSWGEESDLPEWSTSEAEDMDNIGTFDSSGAFMFVKEAEEKERRRFEAGRQRAAAMAKEESGADRKETQNGADTDKDKGSGEPNNEPTRESETAEKTKSGDPEKTKSGGSKGKESRSVSPPSSKSAGRASPKRETPPANSQKPAASGDHHKSNQQVHLKSNQHVQSIKPPPLPIGPTLQEVERQQLEQQQHLRENSPRQPSPHPPQPLHGGAGKDHVNKQPGGEERPAPRGGPAMDQGMRGADPSGLSAVEDDFGHLEKAAEDLVATWTAEEDAKSDCKAKVESGGVPLDHEDAKKWFYRDPQGDLQGPFKAAEMAEWFSAGYFTMNLLVKRGCDANFQPLGELIKRWGRVPFLPGPSPPPFKDSTGIPAAMPAQPPQVDPQQEQLKMLQQQMILQQQFYLQQVQMSQMMATLQQQESFAKLTPQQQQQLALQFMLKHQQQLLQQGQPPPQPAQPTPGQQSPPQQQPPTPQPQQPPQSLSPRSEQQAAYQRQLSQQQAVAAAAAAAQQAAAQQQAAAGGAGGGDAGVAGFHRSVSQPHSEESTIWGGANPVATSAGWTAPTSVWDIEPPKAQSLEEIQRLERLKMEQQQREEVERRESERRRQEEEMRKRQEEEERRRQEEEMRRRQEEERRKQVEMELERQRIEQLERIRLQREAEENARREEERRRREEEERRRREEEERRQREAEERRRLIEEQRRKEQEELERKRQEEIRRRQEKADEMRRQQQEALRRLQQEQMANMQLPSTAQWANSSPSSQGNGAPSLAEIQELESQRAVKEAEEKKRRLEQQRQQLAAIQQQQQQQSNTWAKQRMPATSKAPTTPTTSSSAPSLLEIQQEQAMQLEREKQRQQQQQQKASPTANLPLRTAAVWSGAAQASHWAAEGAWGNPQNRTSAGFWDDAIGGASTKKAAPSTNSNVNSNFPSLSSTVSPQPTTTSNKTKASKAKREEETVQRLFQQAMKPKDEFTQWCENALRGMQSSVDVPTFIVFLQDVESPYEVHDYVRSYLGESKDATEFAKQFLERRSKFKNHLKQDQPEEMWGPAPAVNPNLKHSGGGDDYRSTNNNGPLSGSTGINSNSKNAAKKKKRMQKVDSSILGFTVHADTERLNIGDIEPMA